MLIVFTYTVYGIKLQLKDITARLERIQPKVHSSDGPPNNYTAVQIKPANHSAKRSSPKAAKNSTREVSLFGGSCSLPLSFTDISWLLKPIWIHLQSTFPSYHMLLATIPSRHDLLHLQVHGLLC